MVSSRRHRRGFTLIELMVSIGIIVGLIAVAVPIIIHSRQKAIVIRIKSDLGNIGTALEAYKNDFGDYPRFDDNNSTDSLNVQQDRGARLLCRALLGPAPAALNGGTFGFGPGEQAPDGADGAGFRVRVGGKIWGPYIDATKFKLGNSGAPSGGTGWDKTYFTDATLLDINGYTILYYPGQRKAVINSTSGYFVKAQIPLGVQASNSPGAARPMYNANDNSYYGATTTTNLLSEAQLQYIMGDRNMAGYLASGEQATTTQDYLLWTPGIDGQYGFGINPKTQLPWVPGPGLKTDDITNFDIPPDLQK